MQVSNNSRMDDFKNLLEVLFLKTASTPKYTGCFLIIVMGELSTPLPHSPCVENPDANLESNICRLDGNASFLSGYNENERQIPMFNSRYRKSVQLTSESRIQFVK